MKSSLNSTEINLETLESCALGNQDFIVEIINVYLQEMPIELKILNAEIENKNYNNIVFQAHKMKYNSQLCGVNTLTQLLVSLEEDINNGEGDINFEQIQKEVNFSINDSIIILEAMKIDLLNK